MFKFTVITLIFTVLCHNGWTQALNDKPTANTANTGSNFFESQLFRRRGASSDYHYTPRLTPLASENHNRFANTLKNENAFIRRIGSLTASNYLQTLPAYEPFNSYDSKRYPAHSFNSFDKTGSTNNNFEQKPNFYQLPIHRRYSFEFVQMNTTAKPYEMKSIDIEAAELPPLVLSLGDLPKAQWGEYPTQHTSMVPIQQMIEQRSISSNRTDVIPIKSYFDI